MNINARDADGNPELSFGIDWETSRAAKQGVPQEKDVFIEYVKHIYTVSFGHKRSDLFGSYFPLLKVENNHEFSREFVT